LHRRDVKCPLPGHRQPPRKPQGHVHRPRPRRQRAPRFDSTNTNCIEEHDLHRQDRHGASPSLEEGLHEEALGRRRHARSRTGLPRVKGCKRVPTAGRTPCGEALRCTPAQSRLAGHGQSRRL